MEDDKSRVCGYCITETHNLCRPKIEWYDKVWYCYCKTCRTQEKEEIKTNEEAIPKLIQEQEKQAKVD